jgi:DNA-binding NarL/FixJ family response regulator
MESAIMRVLLADDQEGVRAALRLLLEQESDMEFVGEVADVPSLLDEVSAVQPDLILLDWELPELKSSEDGRRLLSALRQRSPQVQVIALSGKLESGRRALAAGADLFVSKVESPERLLTALRSVRDAADGLH